MQWRRPRPSQPRKYRPTDGRYLQSETILDRHSSRIAKFSPCLKLSALHKPADRLTREFKIIDVPLARVLATVASGINGQGEIVGIYRDSLRAFSWFSAETERIHLH